VSMANNSLSDLSGSCSQKSFGNDMEKRSFADACDSV
jgi:hypothetical protein